MGRSHKETNTYRFQNFSERIALMHIDVVHQIRKKTDDEVGAQSTYFGDALASWVDLNCTQHFVDFQQDMAQFPCTSYVQLVHHAENIVSTLKKHLLVPGTLALEPLLDLVVQMGRDMGPDFYAHFQEIFDILVQLLSANAKDPDSLEKVFCTMAYLYKFLWRYLLQDIHRVYGFFSCLLTQNYKEYIQKFAAESFAFLMRKVKDHDALLDFLFTDLRENPEKTSGVGQLLFEMMKGVKQHFHTVSDKVFVSILHKLGPKEGQVDVPQPPWPQVEEAVGHMMQACATYTSRDQAQHMWATLLAVLTEVHQSCVREGQRKEKTAQPQKTEHLCRLLRMTTVWLDHHDGSIVSNPSAVLKVLRGGRTRSAFRLLLRGN
ncbi:hypothetical protein BaRGS_00028083 [Batillaria attramentaria]|uniref:Uncharacterized protein n=1 Tax=Batillaria attramentaria TaxID=370345 RepID=A0ABD0K1K8_9CAEN